MRHPILLFAFATHAAAAHADCGCFCLNGEPRTICSDLTDAQANARACTVDTHCPPPGELPEAGRYEAPEGAVNCRDAHIYDPVTNAYSRAVRVCDVEG